MRSATAPARPAELHPEALLTLAALAAAVIGQGGFHRPVAAVVVGLLLAAGVVLAARQPPPRLNRLTPVGAGLAALAVTSVLTALADRHPAGAVAPVALLVSAGVVAAVVADADGPTRRLLLDVVGLLGVLVAASGWIGVAFRVTPLGHADGGLWRAATTVTYANAGAAVLAVLGLLALGSLAERPDRAGRLVVTALLVGLGATLSRGGIGAFALGFVVLAALAGGGKVLAAAWQPALAAAVAVVALAVGMSAAHPGRPAVAAAGLALALGIAAVDRGTAARAAARFVPGRRRWGAFALPGHRARLVLLGAGAVVVIGGLAATGLAVDHSYLWSGRIGLSSPDRAGVASAAVDLWRSHLVTGVGPGQALFVWTDAAGRTVYDRYAHDEYLQLAVEQGVAGLVALAALVAGVALTVTRSVRSVRRGAERLPLAAAAAALTAFFAHSALDFLWHVPAVVLVAALALGLAVPSSTPTHNQEESCPPVEP